MTRPKHDHPASNLRALPNGAAELISEVLALVANGLSPEEVVELVSSEEIAARIGPCSPATVQALAADYVGFLHSLGYRAIGLSVSPDLPLPDQILARGLVEHEAALQANLDAHAADEKAPRIESLDGCFCVACRQHRAAGRHPKGAVRRFNRHPRQR